MIGTILVPAFCRGKNGKNNALAVSFAANVSVNPAMVMVGIIPKNYSYDLIKESGEFVINIPTKDFCVFRFKMRKWDRKKVSAMRH